MERPREKNAAAGRLVGRIDLEPKSIRLTQLAHGSGVVSVDQCRHAESGLAGGLKRPSRPMGGHASEFLGSPVRYRTVVRRQGDLDLSRQEARALKAFGRTLLHGAADRCRRGVHIAMRQPQEGEARLGVHAEVERLLEGLVGAIEIAGL